MSNFLGSRLNFSMLGIPSFSLSASGHTQKIFRLFSLSTPLKLIVACCDV